MASAAPALAAPGDPVPPLSGESLTTGFVTADAGYGAPPSDCDPDGVSTVRIQGSGTAYGPYPGPFTESGTLTIAPQTQATTSFAAGTGLVGPILSFTAQFEIVSPVGTVRGTKTLSTAVPSPYNGSPLVNTGACASFENSTVINPPLDPGYYQTVSGRTYSGYIFSTYQATVTTADGTTDIEGTASTSFNEVFLDSATCLPTVSPCYPAGGASNSFGESFITSRVRPTEPVVGPPASVVLTPATATNPVGTSHTVEAAVTDSSGTVLEGVDVLFTVTGATNSTQACTTGSGGTCDITYNGPPLPGSDVITGCADGNGDGSTGLGEPCGNASKLWILPDSTPGSTTGGGQAGDVVFGFNAKSHNGQTTGNCSVNRRADSSKLKCLDVATVVIAGNTATAYGTAEVNGMFTPYRITVTDNGEPGSDRDTFQITTASGYTAGGLLTQGNVQVRP